MPPLQEDGKIIKVVIIIINKNNKKLKPICSKLILKLLLLKLVTLNNSFYKQTDRCKMVGSLSVSFSNILW